jgi:excisionase family DNA binding protein
MAKDMKLVRIEDDEIWTPQETAGYMKVTVASVYQRVARKEIPYIKMGRLLRFKRSALEEYIHKCEQR